MPKQSNFDFRKIHHRSIVQLRVPPSGVELACERLDIPDKALRSVSNYPSAHWLGPEHWLLTSDTKSASDIIQQVETALTTQLHAATDMSSAYTCFEMKGQAARTILSMGCGIDMHISAFKAGHCTRTHFAGVLLLIVAVENDTFNLYVDRSVSRYLHLWIEGASKDPLTNSFENKELL